MLKTYINKYVNKYHPKETALKAFYGILRLIFSYAFNERLIERNPVLEINISNYFNKCTKSSTSEETKILSNEEIETGMRAGEICALKWNDIDYDNLTIHIHTQQTFQNVDNHKVHNISDHTKNEKHGSKGWKIISSN